MLKVIKNSQMLKVVVGAYSNEKAAGLYDRYAKAIMEVVDPFLKKYVEEDNLPVQRKEGRGRIIEESVSPSKDN
jgi:hypothetical protein